MASLKNVKSEYPLDFVSILVWANSSHKVKSILVKNGQENYFPVAVRLSPHVDRETKGTCPKPPDKLLPSITEMFFSSNRA